MAKLIDIDKNTRATLEQQAFRKLQTDLKATPSQEQIYQEAYNTPYPVFSDEYGAQDERAKVDQYLGNLYSAAGRVRKGVRSPLANKQYIKAAKNIFTEGEYDPATRLKILGNLRQQRRAAEQNMFGQAFNKYQAERQQGLVDYSRALNEQNQALSQAQAQESALAEAQAAEQKRQQDLQDYILKKQIDAGFKSGGGPRGPKGPSQPNILDLTDTQTLEMVGLGLDPKNPKDVAKYAKLYAKDKYTENNDELSNEDWLDEFNSLTKEGVNQLESGLDWGSVWNNVRNRLPDTFSNEDIDNALYANVYRDNQPEEEGTFQKVGNFFKNLF